MSWLKIFLYLFQHPPPSLTYPTNYSLTQITRDPPGYVFVPYYKLYRAEINQLTLQLTGKFRNLFFHKMFTIRYQFLILYLINNNSVEKLFLLLIVSVCLSIRPSIHLSTHTPIHPLSNHPFTLLFIYLLLRTRRRQSLSSHEAHSLKVEKDSTTGFLQLSLFNYYNLNYFSKHFSPI